MQGVACVRGLLLSVSVVVLVWRWPATAATKKTYHMTGTITAIEPVYHTVVIEVPQGRDIFTVGWPLSTTAVLKKGGKAVQLQAFKVGEKVHVTWRSTAAGHVIERLEAA